jgi:hypothetical protein
MQVAESPPTQMSPASAVMGMRPARRRTVPLRGHILPRSPAASNEPSGGACIEDAGDQVFDHGVAGQACADLKVGVNTRMRISPAAHSGTTWPPERGTPAA